MADDKLQSDHNVRYCEVIDAVHNPKINKKKCVHGSPSEFFVNASIDLYTRFTLFITAMLSHSHTTQLTTSIIIPEPYGNNGDKILSGNYRAISLISVGKIIDLIILNQYSNTFATSDNQCILWNGVLIKLLSSVEQCLARWSPTSHLIKPLS